MKTKSKTVIEAGMTSQRVKSIRQELRLNQQDFADRLKLSSTTISDIETGRAKPGFDFIHNIAGEFKVNLYYLLYGEGEPFQTPVKETTVNISLMESQDEHTQRFINYFLKSYFVRFNVLGFFQKLKRDNLGTIEAEVEEWEQGNIKKD